ncbi:GNAT family N-acetyltransferase [Aquisphaera insulae]|uniref:GNAT family N-acetyltransferase n=1 Tax=Aquisphaera insulae TaxID=2712864 RepID=UPI0013EE3343|nr:GNAT family N-acetyltransferase [Aquisphaera insulae]
MAEFAFAPVTPLDGGHDRSAFDCGTPALDSYLRNYALQNQKRGIVRNYVVTLADSKVIVAYYSLVYGSIAPKLLPPKLVKGAGRYDIPLMLLARLAVDRRQQGRGLGKALLKDAVLRTMQAAEIAGLKLLLVHAKDDAAADFYRKHGFEPVVDEPLTLFLPVPLSA